MPKDGYFLKIGDDIWQLRGKKSGDAHLDGVFYRYEPVNELAFPVHTQPGVPTRVMLLRWGQAIFAEDMGNGWLRVPGPSGADGPGVAVQKDDTGETLDAITGPNSQTPCV